MQDPYCYPNLRTLRNNLDIHDAERLRNRERDLSNLRGLSVGDFAKRLAYYFAEINALHPFRKGNGRTQRKFIRQLAFESNYFPSYASITKDLIINASIESLKLNYTPLEHLILTHLRPL